MGQKVASDLITTAKMYNFTATQGDHGAAALYQHNLILPLTDKKCIILFNVLQICVI